MPSLSMSIGLENRFQNLYFFLHKRVPLKQKKQNIPIAYFIVQHLPITEKSQLSKVGVSTIQHKPQ